MRRATRLAAAALAAATLGACGHAYYDPVPVPVPVSVGVGIALPIGPGPVEIAGLGLQLTRVGPESIQLDWSSDPYAAVYDVSRDGYPLARVGSTTLVDSSGLIGERYCYQVVGRDGRGVVVSTSSVGCLTLF